MESVAARILAYYDRCARDLPWRRTRDPYAIWVSEIMLQQTRVATVIPYYEAWLAAFPTVKALAKAPLDRVLARWSGLGYYSRARNLHRGAQYVVAEHGGVLPDSVAALRKIPGIGDYTAGAIASIAFQKPEPLVDGNVIRVLARFYGIAEDVTLAKTRKHFWQLARDLVPTRRPGDFNQGLMELGAEVCTPKADCAACCLRADCVARAQGAVLDLPNRPPRVKREDKPLLALHAIWVRDGQRTLLCKRSPGGLFGGLWEVPQARNLGELKKGFLSAFEVEGTRPALRHEQELTHRRLRIDVWPAQLKTTIDTPPDTYESLGWYDQRGLKNLGLSSATRSILLAMQGKRK
jgi:A/G-specific adenine glycosylase